MIANDRLGQGGEASADELDTDEKEAIRRDSAGAETIGDAEGSGAGIGIGSGTPEPEDIGGGKPPISDEGTEPSGTYTPGTSRK